MTKELFTAQIVAVHGRHYLADAGGKMQHFFNRGKKIEVAVCECVHNISTAKRKAEIENLD